MNISSGLSEINMQAYNGGIAKTQKVFTWPSYSQNKIQPVKPAGPQKQDGPLYIKPSEDEKSNLLQQINNNKEASYDASGNGVNQSKMIEPGSFFQALV